MKSFLQEEYIRYKKYILIYLTVVTVLVSSLAFSNINCRVNGSSEDINETVNTTLMDSMYSVTITNAVNPTATLAVLSIIGAIENYDSYFDKSETMDNVAAFLLDLPFLRTAKRLPIANPYAAVIISLLTVGIYLMRSFKASKAVSQATIDKVENVYGFAVSVLLALLPIATSTVAASNGELIEKSTVSVGTFIVTVIVGIMSAIFSGIIFICINMTVDSLELLATIIPIPHANQVMSVLRFILHTVLILLQIFSPILSIICSFIVMVVGLFLFRYAYLFTTYYGAIYGKAISNRIFKKDKVHPLVDKHCPRRIKKAYPSMDVAIPIFSFNKINKCKKRTKFWLVIEDSNVHIVYCKLIRKMKIFDMDVLNPASELLYIHKDLRFIRILSQSKKVDFAVSNIYVNQIDKFRELTGYRDYQGVIDADPNSLDKKFKNLMFWKKNNKQAADN